VFGETETLAKGAEPQTAGQKGVALVL